MTTAVKKLLASFEALSESDQHEAVIEVLKRASLDSYGPLPDQALIELAEQSFFEYDAREAADAKP